MTIAFHNDSLHAMVFQLMILPPGATTRSTTFTCCLPMPLRLVLLLSVIISSIAGCGYTLVGAAAQRRLSVAVTPFLNQTREPGLESHITMALRQAIVRSPNFVLTTAATASQRIEGTIRRFRISPLSFDENDNALQYRLEVVVTVRLMDIASTKPTWEQDLSTSAEYLLSNTGVVRENVVAKEAALFRLAQRFADTLTTLLMVQRL